MLALWYNELWEVVEMVVEKLGGEVREVCAPQLRRSTRG
jgi:hypothetical protein